MFLGRQDSFLYIFSKGFFINFDIRYVDKMKKSDMLSYILTLSCIKIESARIGGGVVKRPPPAIMHKHCSFVKYNLIVEKLIMNVYNLVKNQNWE